MARVKPLPPTLRSTIRLLQEEFPDILVADMPPADPRIDAFIRVDGLGGAEDRTGLLVTPYMAIQVSTRDVADSEALCGQVIAALKSRQFTLLDSEVQIRGWKTVTAPHPFPDPEKDQYRRWQFTGQLGFSNRIH